MPKVTKLKRIGRSYSAMATIDTKYLHWLPSLATIYKGHIHPIGVSFRWLWFGVSFVYVGSK